MPSDNSLDLDEPIEQEGAPLAPHADHIGRVLMREEFLRIRRAGARFIKDGLVMFFQCPACGHMVALEQDNEALQCDVLRCACTMWVIR